MSPSSPSDTSSNPNSVHRKLQGVRPGACGTYAFAANGNDLRTAIKQYATDPLCKDDPNALCATEEQYGGLINDWCVKDVQAMYGLFGGSNCGTACSDFDSNISGWDTSSATTMEIMVRYNVHTSC